MSPTPWRGHAGVPAAVTATRDACSTWNCSSSPTAGRDPTVSELDRLRRSVESVDRKLHDVAIVPVPSLTGMP